MRFALLGDHPDGLDVARALAESGRHQLAMYSGPVAGADTLRRWDLTPRAVGDVEEVLADPTIDAVVVAGAAAVRPAQLRRALQSERPVLCVHPADQGPDFAYEAAMLQTDTGQFVVPLLPEALHPAFGRLAELLKQHGPLLLLEVERWSAESLLLEADTAGHKPSLPGWDVLRRLGGEVAEVSALAETQELDAEAPLLLAGRFERGGLFQVTLAPRRPEARWRLAALTAFQRIELLFPQGWPGPARLTWRDETGAAREEAYPTWNPWPALAEAFERAAAARRPDLVTPAWQDAVRCLELDDAARRSVEKRRSSVLEYQEATEEASFKGSMTLLGCGLLWGSLVLLILSRWWPWLGWVIAPLFGVFLLMQVLRWLVPPRPEPPPKAEQQRPDTASTAITARDRP